MYDLNKIDAEKFIYAFTGMRLSEYADKLLKEFRKEAVTICKMTKPINENLTITEIRREISDLAEKDILYTVAEIAKLIKTNTAYVYQLINTGLLPVLKLGSYKVRRSSLLEFVTKYEGWDLTDPSKPKQIDIKI
jgi:excisionase family DNA binding protein